MQLQFEMHPQMIDFDGTNVPLRQQQQWLHFLKFIAFVLSATLLFFVLFYRFFIEKIEHGVLKLAIFLLGYRKSVKKEQGYSKGKYR